MARILYKKLGSTKKFNSKDYVFVDTGRTEQFALGRAKQIRFTGFNTKVIKGKGPLGDTEWQIYSRPKRLK